MVPLTKQRRPVSNDVEDKEQRLDKYGLKKKVKFHPRTVHEVPEGE